MQQARSQLQRVHYELNTKGELLRLSWPQLDRERGSKPQQNVLLKQVEKIQINAYSDSGSLVTEWPISQSQSATASSLNELPRAIEVIMTVKPWGEIRRYFRLPQNIEATKNAT